MDAPCLLAIFQRLLEGAMIEAEAPTSAYIWMKRRIGCPRRSADSPEAGGEALHGRVVEARD
jgi:hypothetical protein